MADLKLSKQKFVQGMVEFSLETPRTAAAAEAGDAAARANALPAAAATDNIGVSPSGAAVDGDDESKKKTAEKAQARKREPTSSAGEASVSAKGTEGSASTNDKQAAGKSFWAKNRKGPTNEKVQDAKGTDKAAASGQGDQQRRTRSSATDTAAAAPATVKALDDDQGCAAEWEGVTWDENDAPEADSLGSVTASLVGTGSASVCSAGSVTLGTVELASKNGGTALAGLVDTEPKDMLICLKGVVGIRGVRLHQYP